MSINSLIIPTERRNLVGRRVLIADSNPDAAESLALLRLNGHDARIVLNGPSVLDSNQEFLPEVAILASALAADARL
jgi:hypothetical protein